MSQRPTWVMQAMHYRRAQFLLGHMKVLQPFITPQAAARIRYSHKAPRCCSWRVVVDGGLCYAMLCYAMLCYAMLCYAMLCCLGSSLQLRSRHSSTPIARAEL